MPQNASKSELLAVVKSWSGFRGIPENSIRMILEKASLHDYAPSHWLYRQGEPANRFFLLESGLISLRDSTSAGEETIIRFIFPGEPLGCVALSGVNEHVLSAQVLRPSRTLEWDRDTALNLVRDVPRAAANLLGDMISDVIYYHHHIRRLKTDPLERRVQWGLLQLSRALGKSTSEGITIEYPGHRQLAELAGTTVYSVSRELGRLQSKGILRKQRGQILLLHPDRLAGGQFWQSVGPITESQIAS